MKRRNLHQSKRPFDVYPFEALCCDSWQAVELIEIRNGAMTLHFVDGQYEVEDKSPFANIRVRSRPATLLDCTCFLRPGVDVCVLQTPQCAGGSEENLEPVWVDARISSIERKPHESKCPCQFFVKHYVNQGPLGSEKVTLSKKTEVVGINQIAILQKLEGNPCEDQYYRWNFAENCSSVQKTKLFLGKFLSDISWLFVTSVLKQIVFGVRSVNNKIVYQILGSNDNHSPLNSDGQLNAINLKVDNGFPTAIVAQFALADAGEVSPDCVVHEPEPLQVYDVMNLRRSKRRNVQPDRFIGGDIPPEMDVGWVRTMPYKTDKWKEEEMFLPLSCLLGAQASGSDDHTDDEIIRVPFPKISPCEDLLLCKGNIKSRELKSPATDQSEDQNPLAIVPVPAESVPMTHERRQLHEKPPGNYSQKVNEISVKFYNTKVFSTPQRKHDPEIEDMMFESKWWGTGSNKRVQSGRRHSILSKRDDSFETPTHRKTTLSAGAYNKLINSYMKNIGSTMTKDVPHIIDQWKQFKETNCLSQSEGTESTVSEDKGECSEMEMLWNEMELSMASTYLLGDHEGSNAGGLTNNIMPKSNDRCEHIFRLDEEIGILCRLCGFVSTEIRHVSAPFVENIGWTTDNKPCNDDDPGHKLDEDIEDLEIFCNQDSPECPLSEKNNNVWALIPELRKKLHLHQKKAFEFLWKNIAGSLVPAQMVQKSKKLGGCVISHSPGAGKTFLIIAFLVSLLKLFPGKRPLVLAPKTTLYTWYKEFIKWQTPIPVHLIHGRRTYRVFKQKTISVHGVPKPSQDVMHVLDCLDKIQKWHAQPSVLVMGYTSFLTLMREKSKFAHRRYMAQVLRESPGLLVLDEGHNPRSTKSRLRKVLMKVETDLRILLSGTLFQNNFCEYFNTLCLARPKFIHEVLKALDLKFMRNKKGTEKAPNLLEARARKFFLDKIARKIDSNIGEERMQGLNMLRNITNGFIDVYDGGSSDGLPGLQIYTLMMNSKDIQHEILVKLQKIMATYNGYPLELELLITLASIHPWLVKTSNCVNKFFSPEELEELEKLKYDFKKSSKVFFVLNLVYRIVKKEKILIFCHNIAPINLFLELFQNVFGWQKGKEILVLTGDLELFDRGRVIDKFEEPGGPSRVLLASITACAEGISLTAASRVILLDSEWNPSKTKQAIARAFRPGQQRVVYVYQLLATGTLEEDKYRRTTWKEWVSSMIFSEAFVEDPSRWQAEKIEDDVLREMVEEDRIKSFHMIMKNEKASTIMKTEKASTG